MLPSTCAVRFWSPVSREQENPASPIQLPTSSGWARYCAGRSPAARLCKRGCTPTTRSASCRTLTSTRAARPIVIRPPRSVVTCVLARWGRPCCQRTARVLLIDEIDKSDIDLPNDLLNLFVYPAYTVHELARIADRREEVDVLTEAEMTGLPYTLVGLCAGVPVHRADQQWRTRVPARVLASLYPPGARDPRCRAARRDCREPPVSRDGQQRPGSSQPVHHPSPGGGSCGGPTSECHLLTSYAAREQGADRTRLAQLLMRHLDRTS